MYTFGTSEEPVNGYLLTKAPTEPPDTVLTGIQMMPIG